MTQLSVLMTNNQLSNNSGEISSDLELMERTTSVEDLLKSEKEE
jgi:hypothetical protein